MADTDVSDEKQKKGGLGETLKTVIYAVLIAMVVRTVGIEPFNIPSGSMIPTLLIGDYLFVSKYSYGYSRYSLPFSLPLFSGRIFFSAPARGDVAVFKWPRDNKTDYIKRLVGLPGDRIAVRGGVLNINGKPVKLERVGAVQTTCGGFPVRAIKYIETLPGGRRHAIYQQHGLGYLNNTPEVFVPKRSYFAMGDNRDCSQDSRVWRFVPAVNLVGRAEFLFFSINGSARWYEVWKWPGAIRFSRLFTAIR